jgi:dolichol kinase
VVVPALVTLAVLDGVATLATSLATRIYNGKSLEDRWEFCHLPCPASVCFGSGGSHRCCHRGSDRNVSPVDDNLVIPVSVCLLLTVFPALI